ncbi:MAG: DNA polymerase III subunit delta [Xanthomonadales bacterium]|nr:DNA polymerase III subunit delta [Xanthomonadales bacterium]
MPLKPEQLPAALERGLTPVYLIAGPEPLLVQECRDRVLATAREQGFLEREIIHASAKYKWSELEQVAQAGGSLFSSRRCIDLRLPGGKPGREGGAALSEWAERADPDLLLLVSCEQWDANSRKSKWASQLEKAGTRVDIWPVGPNEMPAWIKRRMQAAGLQPDRDAVMLLAQRLEGNLLAAQQEIDKLAILKGGGAVTGDDVLESVIDSSRFDAYLLVERVLEGNLDDGLRVASGLHRTGVAIQVVVFALAGELRALDAFMSGMAAGQNEAALFRKLNIWRSRQAAIRQAARRLDAERLGRAMRELALVDRQGKGRAAGDPWQHLDRLVCELCRA